MKDHGKDPKVEHPGAIAKDSLAAESIRSDKGTFAGGGNPGISGAGAGNSTFAAEGGREMTAPGGKKGSGKDADEAHAPVYQTRSQTRSQSHNQDSQKMSGKESSQRRGSTGGSSDLKSARGSAHTGGSGGATGSTHTGGSHADEAKPMSHHGGDAPANTSTTGGRSVMPAEQRSGETGKVGDADDVEWHKVGRDTKARDIGSEDDPARKAETDMSARAARSTGVTGGGEGMEKVGDQNPYSALEGKEEQA